MKKWIITALVLGFALPVTNVSAEEGFAEITTTSLEDIDEGAEVDAVAETVSLEIDEDEEVDAVAETVSLEVDEDEEVDAVAETISLEIEEEEEDLNWFQRLWRTITGWFSW